MSEYWKSAPKYWCKHCSVFVRDTKLERSNHEATGKHQNNLRRFLRDIHRENEKEERDKQRAKDEIARLNGEPTIRNGQKPKAQLSLATSRTSPREATIDERKQQLAKLAEMGVAIPKEHRQDLAMVGEWQTVQEEPSPLAEMPVFKDDALDDDARKKQRIVLGSKRQAEDFEIDEGARPKLPWGSATKRYKSTNESSVELDTLLRKPELGSPTERKDVDTKSLSIIAKNISHEADVKIKDEDAPSLTPPKNEPKPENDDNDGRIVFKKRKKK